MRRRGTGGGVYARLLADQRAWWADVRARLGYPDKPIPLVEAMEAGEPVKVHAWELPGSTLDYGLHPNDDVIISADDSIEVVAREVGDGDGQVLSFEDAAARRRRVDL